MQRDVDRGRGTAAGDGDTQRLRDFAELELVPRGNLLDQPRQRLRLPWLEVHQPLAQAAQWRCDTEPEVLVLGILVGIAQVTEERHALLRQLAQGLGPRALGVDHRGEVRGIQAPAVIGCRDCFQSGRDAVAALVEGP